MYPINLLLSYVYIFSIFNLFYNQHMYTAKTKKKKKRREFVISTITTFWVQIHVKKTKIVDVKIMKSKAINEVTRDESKVVGNIVIYT
jgi:hypothetical protein